ncbi:osmoprotectant transport system ATP-binding protein [Pedobacter sp. UYP30]|uniref:ABC transporter ATP-binding protein n=1 Tax=Pedobacter sp. UYP30 TaxID=1756400 RepID=UPI0033938289
MIELRNITKFFGEKKALNDVSITVKEGENMVLLGTSGCGKTTTLKLINRLLDPSEGAVLVKGKNVASIKPEVLRREMGYVLQNIGLFPHYTIAENIAVVPKLLGWSTTKIKKRAELLLEKLHLPAGYLNLFPKELSGGQQQRIGLARGLAANPPILLMDEPFGALDNVTRSKIHTDFLGLDELKNKTIIMVTHDVQEAFTLADRICLMNNGKVVQVGTPKELLFKPVDAFAKSFLDGQRLALQFKTTTLADLRIYLPQKQDGAIESIAQTISVWEAMEELRRVTGNKLSVSGKSESEGRTFDFDELAQAFNRYQKTNADD